MRSKNMEGLEYLRVELACVLNENDNIEKSKDISFIGENKLVEVYSDESSRAEEN